MSMMHTVIAKNEKKEILQVIATFSDQQVPIAIKNIRAEYPDAIITVKSSFEENESAHSRK